MTLSDACNRRRGAARWRVVELEPDTDVQAQVCPFTEKSPWLQGLFFPYKCPSNFHFVRHKSWKRFYGPSGIWIFNICRRLSDLCKTGNQQYSAVSILAADRDRL